MATENNSTGQDLRDIIGPDEAERMVDAILYPRTGSETKPLVKVLAIIERHITDATAKDSLRFLMEAAYNKSIEHDDNLNEYIEACLREDDEPSPRAPESSPELASGNDVSDERVENVMRLGEQLAAILENPETPVDLYNELVDTISDLETATDPGNAVRLRENWPRIAEHLLSKPSPRVPTKEPTRKEQNRQQVIRELAGYADRDGVIERVETVLWAAQRTNSEEEFEHQVLADALALVIKSVYTPQALYNDLVQMLCDISMETKAQDPADPDNIREWFPIALARLKKQKQEQSE